MIWPFSIHWNIFKRSPTQKASVSFSWLVVVFGNARASDWTGPGRQRVHGRPLHVFSLDWNFPGDRTGNHDRRATASFKERNYCNSRNSCRCGVPVADETPVKLLAK